MFYAYVELEDGTHIAYSNVLPDDTVELAVERPVELGFDSARCAIPSFEWSNVEGFTREDMEKLDSFVHRNTPLILRLSREVSRSYA